MDHLKELKNNKEIFFNFMKEKYPVINNSNIFLRDLLYAVKNYFEKKEKLLSYSQSEKLALEFAQFLEESNELKKVGNNSWKVNFLTQKDVIKTEPTVN
jgi:hypothetical protein